MSVTQVKQGVGQWSVRLRGTVPRRILDALENGYFGHVAVIPGAGLNVEEYGDALLDAARYVGVYRTKSANDEGTTISGPGLEMWLGDENGFGDVFETPVELDADTFADTITALLPPGGAITAGTIHSVAGTYTGRHQWVTPRTALDYATSVFGAEWRVNPNGTLDAGTESQLFVTSPQAILVSREDPSDLRFRSLPGNATMARDNSDYTTRVVVLGQGEGDTIQTGSADLVGVPYNDIHGNEVVITRVVSEYSTDGTNVDTRASILLDEFGRTSPSVTLNTSAYDIKGDVAVGDYIWVYNPARGFVDVANEVDWMGEFINPVKLRVVELTWPIREGWTVAFRDNNGDWYDLTPNVFFEGGSTNVVVGDLPRSISGGVTEPIGSRPGVDTTIPNAPAFVSFDLATYQTDGATSTTKAAVRVSWTTPLNSDGSVILDGDHYEIRYRVAQVLGYRVKWGQLAAYKWGELLGNPWGAPVSSPVEADPEWQTSFVGWGTNDFTVMELTPGVTYEFQIRAVDAQTPPNQSPWSSATEVTTVGDLFAPQVPAAPVVAASRIAVQIVHTLGQAAGGTFNLDPDLDHLEIHVGGSEEFLADDSTLVGKLVANAGMMLGGIPAVGTFPVEQTDQIHVKVRAVDRSGNKSSASISATVTAELIDNAHISDLSVSKVTAGTITSDWIIGARIKTADAGARVEMNADGIQAYDGHGNQTVDIDSETGDAAFVGDFTAGDPEGNRVEIKDGGAIFNNGPALSMYAIPLDDTEEPFKAVLEHVNEDPYGTFTRLARWPVDPSLQDDYSAGLLMQSDATLLFNTTNGGESQLGLGYVNAGRVYIRGYWKDNQYVSNEDAIWTAAIHTGAGFSSWGHTYGPTMDSTMAPAIGLHSAALVTSWNITASSTTGFTVTWSGTADKWLYVWSARMG
jgi:hypothetical protein